MLLNTPALQLQFPASQHLLTFLSLSLCEDRAAVEVAMRMSCNGCRVLRKGCSDDCTIRPCLQWIKSPDSQANATLFLAKSYGRAGLLNLINVGPQHLRPAIFKSLLYEACGRIVNPIYGAVGLLWSGNWAKCQGAVEAVLAGSSPIMGGGDYQALFHPNAHLKACDIRGVPKKEDSISAASRDVLHKVKARAGFKRSVIRPRPQVIDSWLSQDNESMFSVETVEASPANHAKRAPVWEFHSQIEDGEVDLELTLGLAPVHAH